MIFAALTVATLSTTVACTLMVALYPHLYPVTIFVLFVLPQFIIATLTKSLFLELAVMWFVVFHGVYLMTAVYVFPSIVTVTSLPVMDTSSTFSVGSIFASPFQLFR